MRNDLGMWYENRGVIFFKFENYESMFLVRYDVSIERLFLLLIEEKKEVVDVCELL